MLLETTSSRFPDLREYSPSFLLPLGRSLTPCSARCRNEKRTLENLNAGDVELSAEELAEIAQLLEKYPRKGARYIDGVKEDQLNLWN